MFFITFIALYLIANGWILYSAWPLIRPLPPILKIAATVLFAAVVLLFPSLMFFRDELGSGRFGNFLYSASSVWLAITLYLTLLLIAAALLRLLGIIVPHSFGICCAITAVLLVYGYLNFNRPVVRNLKIELADNTAANGEPRQLRIAAVSDIHLGHGIAKKRLEKYVSLINSRKPDLILICGDLVDSSVEPLYECKMEEELGLLKARYGIYMVPGNHEYISGIEKCGAFIRLTPIVLLRDSVVTIEGMVNIAGRDDRSNRRRKSVRELMDDTENRLPTIILDHQPADTEVESAVKEKAALALYGHTHKGQIWPFSLLTKAIYTHDYGYGKIGQTHIYVSSGLGLWGPPLRIGSRSEIAVIELTLRN